MRFSKRFRSFGDWLKDKDRSSGYVKRIIRLHNIHPQSSLNALRGHTEGRKALRTASSVPLYKRLWSTLTIREKVARQKSLDVLSLARRTGTSLSQLAKDRGIPLDTVLKNTRAFKKIKGRWKPSKRDIVSRMLLIYEDGQEKFIEVRDSRYASLIGKYHSAIKEYLENGNLEALKELTSKLVRDSDGNYHTLETDPDVIRAIAESKETEFNESIYEGLE